MARLPFLRRSITPSPIVITTLQAAALSATSNILAQVIQSYRKDIPLILDPFQLSRFALQTIILTPPNYRWQQFLERQFPATQVPKPNTKKEDDLKDNRQKLNIKNTLIKFMLDMTLGAIVNTCLFIALIGALKGMNVAEILEACKRDVVPLILAGLKLWPLVSILNFAFVPVDRRIIVGSIVGLFWNIYLSILAA